MISFPYRCRLISRAFFKSAAQCSLRDELPIREQQGRKNCKSTGFGIRMCEEIRPVALTARVLSFADPRVDAERGEPGDPAADG